MLTCGCKEAAAASWLGDFLYHISPALVGVSLAALISGILVNRFFVKKANLAGMVERVCDCLDGLRDEAGAYWCVDFDPAKATEFHVMEAKIKAQVLHVNALVVLIAQRHGKVPDDLRFEILNLQDASTGGGFETVSRKADRSRYMKIVSSINKVAVELQRLKI